MQVESRDDAASLREALAWLSDCDTDFESLLVPSSPPSPLRREQHQSPPQAVDKRRKKNARTEYSAKRDARKATVANLHAQIEHLRQVLAQEQARIALQSATNSSSPLAQECNEIIARQKRQRVLAEADNKQLRESWKTQYETTERIRYLTSKAATLAELAGLVANRELNGSLVKYNGPAFTIPQHIRYLDCHVDEANAVLSSGLFAVNTTDFQRVSFRDLGFDGLQVEFAIAWTVPFGVDAVAAAMWAHMTCSQHHARRTDHQLTHASGDLLCATFVSEPSSPDQPNCNHGQAIDGTTHGQTAVRRYGKAIDGSCVLVSRIRAGIFDDDGKPKGDMHGDGWFLVEPLTPKTSRIKWCRRATGRPVNHESTTSADRARWVHSVVTGPLHRQWESNLAHNVQAIENQLLLPKGGLA